MRAMHPGWEPNAYATTQPQPDRAGKIRLVGTLLIIHGALMLVWFAFCVMGASVGALTHVTGSQEPWESTLMMVGYGLFAVGAFAAGTLQLVAGLRLVKGRNRVLALVAMWVGLAAFFVGAVFCFPTAIGLVIYGHIVLLDPGVVATFHAPQPRTPPPA